jgi:large subunit ribosomal protein L22
MEYKAIAQNIKVTPRKARLVADAVRGLSVANALSQLNLLHKRAALPLKKVLDSAVANAVHNGKEGKGDLVIKEIMINEGISYKRYHFAARGRIRPYKKRTSNIRVVVASKKAETKMDKAMTEVKKEETK